MKRIESVEKITKEQFNKKGIAHLMSQINIKFLDKLDEMKEHEIVGETKKVLQRKLMQLLKRCKDISDIHEIINNLPKSFNDTNIYVQPLAEQNFLSGDIEYLAKVLYVTINNNGKIKWNKKENYLDSIKENLPLAVKVSTNCDEIKEVEFLTLGNMRISPSIHRSTGWFFKNHKQHVVAIKDLSSILAEIFLVNAIIEFTLKNTEIYEYSILDYYIKRFYSIDKELLYLPIEPDLIKLVKQQISKYRGDLIIKDYKDISKNDEDIQQINSFARILTLKREGNKIENVTNREIIHIMIRDFLLESDYVKNKSKLIHQSFTEYAKAYQTKKHINLQHQETMKNNSFLERFSTVELDNIVDLNKFRGLEKEFIKLSQQINIPERGIDFRIKRLGKHKARGLFYPKPIGCLIVDRNGISSFTHEIGHLIDYELESSELSEGISFKRTYQLYKNDITTSANKLRKTESNTISGKKLNYFLQKTEVFARSFEIYCYYFLGIRNSLLKEQKDFEDGIEYPISNKDYMVSVKNYFDELIKRYPVNPIATNNGSRENKSKRLLPSTDKYFYDEEVTSEFKQLSFF